MGELTAAQVEDLRRGVAGVVLAPGDDGYDDARRVHNGLVDKRPAVIARCTTTADVAAAVRLGIETGVEIAVRGGGHNVAGKAVTDGGVMIDLSLMKRIQVDPDAKTVTAEGGVTWGDLNGAAHRHGLATTGGVISTTGVAGLTLGGGVGWMMGKYGLAIDNLRAAQVVLASGEVVVADEASDPDLFWAIRGGGGNFGVATSLSYQLHPLDTVLGGPAVHTLAAASDVFGFYREFSSSAPDELTTFAAFRHAPDGSGMKLCALPVCHVGRDTNAAEADVKPVRDFGPPAMDLIERMPYPAINTQLDDGFPKGTLNYWKSAFMANLGDDAVAQLVEAFENTPTDKCFLVIEHLHGAVTRVAPTATAFPHRSPGYNCIIISQWTNPADTTAGIRWARETYESLESHMVDGAYVNYLDQDDAARVQAAYGPNYERLVQLKRRYDPDNAFRLNQNIAP